MTNSPMTARLSDRAEAKRKRLTRLIRAPAPQQLPELYQVIIQCRDESQQRLLFERLRREGYACRLTVL